MCSTSSCSSMRSSASRLFCSAHSRGSTKKRGSRTRLTVHNAIDTLPKTGFEWEHIPVIADRDHRLLNDLLKTAFLEDSRHPGRAPLPEFAQGAYGSPEGSRLANFLDLSPLVYQPSDISPSSIFLSGSNPASAFAVISGAELTLPSIRSKNCLIFLAAPGVVAVFRSSVGVSMPPNIPSFATTCPIARMPSNGGFSPRSKI